ncbi:hypothetical protein GCM10010195_52730 [Kitasatospora griseola]|nr:hypothetical protein GCM10010195_52730 [Kitasatospora griseola]
MNALSSALCLSGQTPVAIVDQPGPERVGASGFAYRLEVAVVPEAISTFRFGASAVTSLSYRVPSMPITSVLACLVPFGRPL